MNESPRNNRRNNRQIAFWLFIVCALIFAMVVLGGVTRLTRSGLSMVEWEPIMGIIPPLSQAEWLETFEKYKQFPEYQKINKGMTLDEFKYIFSFEYAHRVLGRLIGLAFLLPFLYFLFARKIQHALRPKLVIMFVLGALQGLLGWYMVKSGLVDKPHVSQYRLTAHLTAAIAIYGYIFWVALGLLREQRQFADRAPTGLGGLGALVTALVVLMIMSGGFVAGTKAGFVFNTFPHMDGHWLPPGGMALTPWWSNLFDNLATVQFTHRVLALVVTLAILGFWYKAWRSPRGSVPMGAFNLLLLALLVQVTLGINTLIHVVPVWLGATHQAGALVLFSAALYLNHRLSIGR